MNTYLSETKVTSVLDSGCTDRYLNFLNNTFNYRIAVLSTHFLIGDELDKNEYNMLSDNTKNTIELVEN